MSEDSAYATLPARGWSAHEYADFLNAIVSSPLGSEIRRVVDDLLEEIELECE